MERKLAAIFSTDVQGYSRLMGDDEEATVHTITAYRNLIASLIQQHHGRVVDSPGDNLLAEFASVVDAVRCAVDTQNELGIRNATLPDNRKMRFRIGINLGDVLVEGERIYGDGVNIAARIEGLAEGGGVCISGTVYDQVVNKLALEYDSLGEQRVKNIARLVRVYRVRTSPDAAATPVIKTPAQDGGARRKTVAAALCAMVLVMGVALAWMAWHAAPTSDAPASREDAVQSRPGKPSIAVLAFDHLGGDPKDAYLSDGFSENIITQLAKIPQMLVIARNSSFAYKGQQINIAQVGRELGVGYVLEGSVQKRGDHIRITAQLIETATRTHLWAEKYDRSLGDFFAIQDEIALKVAKSLQIKLTQGEKSSLLTHSTDNLEAWAAAMKSLEYYYRFTKEDHIEVQRLLQRAIALDPNFAWAYATLGWTYWQAAQRGWSPDSDRDFMRAREMAEQSLAIDDNVALAHALRARLHANKSEFDEAISEGQRALELEPNNPDIHMTFAWRLMYVGRLQEAIRFMETAKRLHPYHPPLYFLAAGRAFYLAERYEEALAEFQQELKATPRSFRPNANLAAIYTALGRHDEARVQTTEVLRKRPEFSAKQYAAEAFGAYKNPQIETVYFQRLRQAGLPD